MCLCRLEAQSNDVRDWCDFAPNASRRFARTATTKISGCFNFGSDHELAQCEWAEMAPSWVTDLTLG